MNIFLSVRAGDALCKKMAQPSRRHSRLGGAVLVVSFCVFALAAAAPSSRGQSGVALDNGLVAYLPFERNVTAASGTAGAIQAKAVGEVGYDQGVVGSALVLHGNDYVELADSPSLHSPTFSICAWICPTQEQSSGRIAEKGSSNSYWLNLAANKVRCGLYSGGYFEVDSATVLSANEWAFVAGTYDGETLRVYIDGKLDAMATSKPARVPRFNSQSLLIGWKEDGIAADHFVGGIDELRLYNRALSPAEVQALASKAAH